jgi:hypothetical protein
MTRQPRPEDNKERIARVKSSLFIVVCDPGERVQLEAVVCNMTGLAVDIEKIMAGLTLSEKVQ